MARLDPVMTETDAPPPTQGLARESHVVPKFFLRRFRGDDGLILVFDKQGADRVRTH